MSYHNPYTLNGSFSARSAYKGKPKPSPCVVMRRIKGGGFEVGIVPQDFSNDAVRPNRRFKPKWNNVKSFANMEDAQIYLDNLLSHGCEK